MIEPRVKRHFEHLAQRVFNVPLMIEETKAEMIAAALQSRLGIFQVSRIDGTVLGANEMQALAGDARRSWGDNWKPYRTDGQVAVIEVDGTLVHKFGWLDPMSGMTGYDGIAKKLRAAMKDDDVKAIWFDIDSPGGETAGVFQLAELIALNTKSEGGKPIWAYVNEQACSAAYALASVCDKIYAPVDAIAGSIGCYCMHVDFTAALDEAGIKVTMIRSGERKARGNAYEPLEDSTLAKLQAWVDDTRERFARLVAEGRRLSFKSVMATEADWFQAGEAQRLGLIDDLMSEEDAWDKLLRSISRSR